MTAGKYRSSERYTVRSPVAQDEKEMVAEVAHELGNLFHKLYYWSERIEDGRPARQHDMTATHMLRGTIRSLEGLMRGVLEYFHPAQLSLARMPVAEVVAGVVGRMRDELVGRPIVVRDCGDRQGTTVLVDPARFSQAVLVAIRRLAEHVRDESSFEVGVEHAWRGAPGLAIELAILNPESGSVFFRTAAAGVEWAVAERVLALHGGLLAEGEPNDEEKRLTLVLPLAS